MQLFRPEALAAQNSLHGDVALAPPVSWQALGSFLFVIVVSAIAFLSTARYAQTTVVDGVIASDLGIARVTPTASGYVDRLLVRDGQKVRKGDALLVVSASSGDSSPEARRSSAMDDRTRILDSQAPMMTAATRADIDRLEAHVAGDREQMAQLASQISDQETLVASAKDDLAKISVLISKGFISMHEINLRRDLVVTREQDLSRLRETLSSRQTDALESEADAQKMRAQLSIDLSHLADTKASVARDSASDENLRVRTLYAPASGTVTGLIMHPGDPVAADHAVMAIVPSNAGVEATVQIPPQAAGLVEPGQPVQISVDAFPDDTYGTIRGRLADVSAATVATDADAQHDAFVGRVTLERSSIESYGTRRALRPGMTVKARIRTRTRSLIQWMFDPFYAVARR